jgi:hypothetical protein
MGHGHAYVRDLPGPKNVGDCLSAEKGFVTR